MLGAATTLIDGAIARLARRLPLRPKLAQRLAMYGMSTQTALRRIGARGLDGATIIDVGASDGRWSLEASRVLPRVRYHLVEANKVHRAQLEALCAGRPEFTYSMVAAGPCDGEIAFDDRNPFGGRADPDDRLAHPVVPQRSLASLAHELDLPPPYLIKLDTHGYELPILDGAAPLFEATSLLVIEAYTFALRTGSPRFHELCAYMETHGFAVIDLAEPMWREYDGSLWQFDLFFVPTRRTEFAFRHFR